MNTRRLGRFELLRELGRGAQASVWLAHDPRLDREVALKLLDAADPSADAPGGWLQEARAVSRLAHPNVVPVFEADEHEGRPYLVFEYVEGPTLAQARRGRGALPPREAVSLLLGILDALAAAHEHGIVHRDLKPSNVLLGADGRPRVMDFGIAARMAAGTGRSTPHGAGHRIVGTPGYISPEAARGDAPLPAMDVFAAGALLAELLCGRPLLVETDAMRALHRVQHEDLLLPPDAAADATLRGIVQRAVARDAAARYDGAGALHRALSAWLEPPQEAAKAADTTGQHATLEFLLRRMRHKTDFPALTASVVRIQRVAQSESESLSSLTDEILKDVALTNKLLRMVNTAQFTAVAGGGIATVSRAVALVGFGGVRNMALSVVLLEHMNDKAHAAQLRDEFLRALMAGTLADELAPLQPQAGEEAFLGAMFQSLGRLLTECYFPEEAAQIRQRLGARAADPEAGAARESAARHVLGIGLDDLGAGVARAWGLPDVLQRAMRPPVGDPPSRPPLARGADARIETLRWLARGANAVTDAMLLPPSGVDALVPACERYAAVLGLAARDVADAAHTARGRLAQLAQALGLQTSPGSSVRRLLDAGVAAPARRTLAAEATPLLTFDATLQTPPPPAAAGAAPSPAASTTPPEPGAAAPSLVRERLAAALADVRGNGTGAVLRVNEVLQRVLDTVHRALACRRVVLCLREAGHAARHGGGHLVGRIGLGDGAALLCPRFRIRPDAAAVDDLFGWICARGSDLLVSDARSVAARLPAWYRGEVDAATFLLLPLMLNGAAIGLIYADDAQPGAIVLAAEELTLVRALRDEAVAAFARGQPKERPRRRA